jgi:hypothetical protein
MRFGTKAAYSALLSGALLAPFIHGAPAQDAPPPPSSAAPPPQAAAPPPPPPEAAAPPPPAGAPPGRTTVTGTTVNLRQGPGTTYTVVTKIPAGAPISVSGCDTGWCQVMFQGQNGYIIESSIGPRGPSGPPGVGGPPPGPPPGYAGPPPGYAGPPPGYYPPPPPYYYGPGPYYGPYYGWRRGYYRRW